QRAGCQGLRGKSPPREMLGGRGGSELPPCGGAERRIETRSTKSQATKRRAGRKKQPALLFRGPRGEFGSPGKTAGRSTGARGGVSLRGDRRRTARLQLLLPSGNSRQTLLILEHQQPALIRQEPVPLHLVDQRRNKRARGADQVRKVLLCDAVQAQFVSGRDALAVRRRQRLQHLREAGRHVLPGQAEHPLPKLPYPLVQRADDVDRQRRPGLEQGAEIAALDA